MPKKKPFLKIVSSTLVVIFLTSDLVAAAPLESAPAIFQSSAAQRILQNPDRLEIPAAFADLKEISHGTNGRLVIHIQDPHANVSGQENIVKTLDDLFTRYRLSLVLSEGGEGDCTLTDLKKLATPAVWQRIARSYLIEGRMAAEEYLNLTSNHPMKIVGIEDLPLYFDSVQGYEALAGGREKTMAFWSRVNAGTEKLKKKSYPAELLTYEKAAASETNPQAALKILFEIAARHHIDLLEFPELLRLIDLELKERLVDFKMAALEQAALAEAIHAKGGGDELKELFDKVRALKDKKLSQLAYFQKTFDIAQSNGIAMSSYPNLTAYGKYLSDFAKIDLEKVFAEREAAERKIYAAILGAGENMKLRETDRFVDLLEKAYRIRMSSDDFARFKADQPWFETDELLAFLNRSLAETGYFEDVLPRREVFEEGKKSLDAFYASIDKRDEAFVRNIDRAMADNDQKIAVVITGGYHTAHLKKLLAENGYSFAVVAPHVTSETNQGRYEKLLFSRVQKEAPSLTLTEGKTTEGDSVRVMLLASAAERGDTSLTQLKQAAPEIMHDAVPDEPAQAAAARLAGDMAPPGYGDGRVDFQTHTFDPPLYEGVQPLPAGGKVYFTLGLPEGVSHADWQVGLKCTTRSGETTVYAETINNFGHGYYRFVAKLPEGTLNYVLYAINPSWDGKGAAAVSNKWQFMAPVRMGIGTNKKVVIVPTGLTINSETPNDIRAMVDRFGAIVSPFYETAVREFQGAVTMDDLMLRESPAAGFEIMTALQQYRRIIVKMAAHFVFVYSQYQILTQLSKSWTVPAYFVGESLGQEAAMVLSGAVRFEDFIYFLRERLPLGPRVAEKKYGRIIIPRQNAEAVKELIVPGYLEVFSYGTHNVFLVVNVENEQDLARTARQVADHLRIPFEQVHFKYPVGLLIHHSFNGDWFGEEIRRIVSNIQFSNPRVPLLDSSSEFSDTLTTADEVSAAFVNTVMRTVFWQQMDAVIHGSRRIWLSSSEHWPWLAQKYVGGARLAAFTPLAPGSKVLAFGSSSVAGVVAPEASFPSQLAALTGFDVVNAGVPGERIEGKPAGGPSTVGLDRIVALLERHQPALLILWHGRNDFFDEKKPAFVEAALNRIIDEARKRSVQVLLLGSPAKTLAGDAPVYAKVAADRGVPYLRNIYADVLENRGRMADDIHANAEGNRIFAERVRNFLAEHGALAGARLAYDEEDSGWLPLVGAFAAVGVVGVLVHFGVTLPTVELIFKTDPSLWSGPTHAFAMIPSVAASLAINFTLAILLEPLWKRYERYAKSEERNPASLFVENHLGWVVAAGFVAGVIFLSWLINKSAERRDVAPTPASLVIPKSPAPDGARMAGLMTLLDEFVARDSKVPLIKRVLGEQAPDLIQQAMRMDFNRRVLVTRSHPLKDLSKTIVYQFDPTRSAPHVKAHRLEKLVERTLASAYAGGDFSQGRPPVYVHIRPGDKPGRQQIVIFGTRKPFAWKDLFRFHFWWNAFQLFSLRETVKATNFASVTKGFIPALGRDSAMALKTVIDVRMYGDRGSYTGTILDNSVHFQAQRPAALSQAAAADTKSEATSVADANILRILNGRSFRVEEGSPATLLVFHNGTHYWIQFTPIGVTVTASSGEIQSALGGFAEAWLKWYSGRTPVFHNLSQIVTAKTDARGVLFTNIHRGATKNDVLIVQGPPAYGRETLEAFIQYRLAVASATKALATTEAINKTLRPRRTPGLAELLKEKRVADPAMLWAPLRTFSLRTEPAATQELAGLVDGGMVLATDLKATAQALGLERLEFMTRLKAMEEHLLVARKHLAASAKRLQEAEQTAAGGRLAVTTENEIVRWESESGESFDSEMREFRAQLKQLLFARSNNGIKAWFRFNAREPGRFAAAATHDRKRVRVGHEMLKESLPDLGGENVRVDVVRKNGRIESIGIYAFDSQGDALKDPARNDELFLLVWRAVVDTMELTVDSEIYLEDTLGVRDAGFYPAFFAEAISIVTAADPWNKLHELTVWVSLRFPFRPKEAAQNLARLTRAAGSFGLFSTANLGQLIKEAIRYYFEADMAIVEAYRLEDIEEARKTLPENVREVIRLWTSDEMPDFEAGVALASAETTFSGNPKWMNVVNVLLENDKTAKTAFHYYWKRGLTVSQYVAEESVRFGFNVLDEVTPENDGSNAHVAPPLYLYALNLSSIGGTGTSIGIRRGGSGSAFIHLSDVQAVRRLGISEGEPVEVCFWAPSLESASVAAASLSSIRQREAGADPKPLQLIAPEGAPGGARLSSAPKRKLYDDSKDGLDLARLEALVNRAVESAGTQLGTRLDMRLVGGTRYLRSGARKDLDFAYVSDPIVNHTGAVQAFISALQTLFAEEGLEIRMRDNYPQAGYFVYDGEKEAFQIQIMQKEATVHMPVERVEESLGLAAPTFETQMEHLRTYLLAEYYFGRNPAVWERMRLRYLQILKDRNEVEMREWQGGLERLARQKLLRELVADKRNRSILEAAAWERNASPLTREEPFDENTPLLPVEWIHYGRLASAMPIRNESHDGPKKLTEFLGRFLGFREGEGLLGPSYWPARFILRKNEAGLFDVLGLAFLPKKNSGEKAHFYSFGNRLTAEDARAYLAAVRDTWYVNEATAEGLLGEIRNGLDGSFEELSVRLGVPERPLASSVHLSRVRDILQQEIPDGTMRGFNYLVRNGERTPMTAVIADRHGDSTLANHIFNFWIAPMNDRHVDVVVKFDGSRKSLIVTQSGARLATGAEKERVYDAIRRIGDYDALMVLRQAVREKIAQQDSPQTRTLNRFAMEIGLPRFESLAVQLRLRYVSAGPVIRDRIAELDPQGSKAEKARVETAKLVELARGRMTLKAFHQQNGSYLWTRATRQLVKDRLERIPVRLSVKANGARLGAKIDKTAEIAQIMKTAGRLEARLKRKPNLSEVAAEHPRLLGSTNPLSSLSHWLRDNDIEPESLGIAKFTRLAQTQINSNFKMDGQRIRLPEPLHGRLKLVAETTPVDSASKVELIDRKNPSRKLTIEKTSENETAQERHFFVLRFVSSTARETVSKVEYDPAAQSSVTLYLVPAFSAFYDDFFGIPEEPGLAREAAVARHLRSLGHSAKGPVDDTLVLFRGMLEVPSFYQTHPRFLRYRRNGRSDSRWILLEDAKNPGNHAAYEWKGGKVWSVRTGEEIPEVLMVGRTNPQTIRRLAGTAAFDDLNARIDKSRLVSIEREPAFPLQRFGFKGANFAFTSNHDLTMTTFEGQRANTTADDNLRYPLEIRKANGEGTAIRHAAPPRSISTYRFTVDGLEKADGSPATLIGRNFNLSVILELVRRKRLPGIRASQELLDTFNYAHDKRDKQISRTVRGYRTDEQGNIVPDLLLDVETLEPATAGARLSIASAGNPFPQLTPGWRWMGEGFFIDMSGKDVMRHLQDGGPIRQPDFFVSFNQSEFMAPERSARFEDIAGKIFDGQLPLPLVLKPNYSALGIGVVHLEKNAEAVRMTMAYNAHPNLNAVQPSQVEALGIGPLVLDAERNIMSFDVRSEEELVKLWELAGASRDPGMIESGIAAPLYRGTLEGRSMKGAYETRHFFKGNLKNGKASSVHRKNIGRIGTSGYFSNRSGRQAAIKLRSDAMYEPLFEAYPELRGRSADFEAQVDRLILSEFDHVRARLNEAGLNPNLNVSGHFDLMWLPPAEPRGFPIPVIVESYIRPEATFSFDSMLFYVAPPGARMAGVDKELGHAIKAVTRGGPLSQKELQGLSNLELDEISPKAVGDILASRGFDPAKLDGISSLLKQRLAPPARKLTRRQLLASGGGVLALFALGWTFFRPHDKAKTQLPTQYHVIYRTHFGLLDEQKALPKVQEGLDAILAKGSSFVMVVEDNMGDYEEIRDFNDETKRLIGRIDFETMFNRESYPGKEENHRKLRQAIRTVAANRKMDMATLRDIKQKMDSRQPQGFRNFAPITDYLLTEGRDSRFADFRMEWQLGPIEEFIENRIQFFEAYALRQQFWEELERGDVAAAEEAMRNYSLKNYRAQVERDRRLARGLKTLAAPGMDILMERGSEHLEFGVLEEELGSAHLAYRTQLPSQAFSVGVLAKSIHSSGQVPQDEATREKMWKRFFVMRLTFFLFQPRRADQETARLRDSLVEVISAMRIDELNRYAGLLKGVRVLSRQTRVPEITLLLMRLDTATDGRFHPAIDALLAYRRSGARLSADDPQRAERGEAMRFIAGTIDLVYRSGAVPEDNNVARIASVKSDLEDLREKAGTMELVIPASGEVSSYGSGKHIRFSNLKPLETCRIESHWEDGIGLRIYFVGSDEVSVFDPRIGEFGSTSFSFQAYHYRARNLEEARVHSPERMMGLIRRAAELGDPVEPDMKKLADFEEWLAVFRDKKVRFTANSTGAYVLAPFRGEKVELRFQRLQASETYEVRPYWEPGFGLYVYLVAPSGTHVYTLRHALNEVIANRGEAKFFDGHIRLHATTFEAAQRIIEMWGVDGNAKRMNSKRWRKAFMPEVPGAQAEEDDLAAEVQKQLAQRYSPEEIGWLLKFADAFSEGHDMNAAIRDSGLPQNKRKWLIREWAETLPLLLTPLHDELSGARLAEKDDFWAVEKDGEIILDRMDGPKAEKALQVFMQTAGAPETSALPRFKSSILDYFRGEKGLENVSREIANFTVNVEDARAEMAVLSVTQGNEWLARQPLAPKPRPVPVFSKTTDQDRQRQLRIVSTFLAATKYAFLSQNNPDVGDVYEISTRLGELAGRGNWLDPARDPVDQVADEIWIQMKSYLKPQKIGPLSAYLQPQKIGPLSAYLQELFDDPSFGRLERFAPFPKTGMMALTLEQQRELMRRLGEKARDAWREAGYEESHGYLGPMLHVNSAEVAPLIFIRRYVLLDAFNGGATATKAPVRTLERLHILWSRGVGLAAHLREAGLHSERINLYRTDGKRDLRPADRAILEASGIRTIGDGETPEGIAAFMDNEMLVRAAAEFLDLYPLWKEPLRSKALTLAGLEGLTQADAMDWGLLAMTDGMVHAPSLNRINDVDGKDDAGLRASDDQRFRPTDAQYWKIMAETFGTEGFLALDRQIFSDDNTSSAPDPHDAFFRESFERINGPAVTDAMRRIFSSDSQSEKEGKVRLLKEAGANPAVVSQRRAGVIHPLDLSVVFAPAELYSVGKENYFSMMTEAYQATRAWDLTNIRRPGALRRRYEAAGQPAPFGAEWVSQAVQAEGARLANELDPAKVADEYLPLVDGVAVADVLETMEREGYSSELALRGRAADSVRNVRELISTHTDYFGTIPNILYAAVLVKLKRMGREDVRVQRPTVFDVPGESGRLQGKKLELKAWGETHDFEAYFEAYVIDPLRQAMEGARLAAVTADEADRIVKRLREEKGWGMKELQNFNPTVRDYAEALAQTDTPQSPWDGLGSELREEFLAVLPEEPGYESREFLVPAVYILLNEAESDRLPEITAWPTEREGRQIVAAIESNLLAMSGRENLRSLLQPVSSAIQRGDLQSAKQLLRAALSKLSVQYRGLLSQVALSPEALKQMFRDYAFLELNLTLLKSVPMDEAGRKEYVQSRTVSYNTLERKKPRALVSAVDVRENERKLVAQTADEAIVARRLEALGGREAEFRGLTRRYLDAERLVHRINHGYVNPQFIKALFTVSGGTVLSSAEARAVFNDQVIGFGETGTGSEFDRFLDTSETVSTSLEVPFTMGGPGDSGFANTGILLIYRPEAKDIRSAMAFDMTDIIHLTGSFFLDEQTAKASILDIPGLSRVREESVVLRGLAFYRYGVMSLTRPGALTPREVRIPGGIGADFLEKVVVADDLYEQVVAQTAADPLLAGNVVKQSEYFAQSVDGTYRNAFLDDSRNILRQIRDIDASLPQEAGARLAGPETEKTEGASSRDGGTETPTVGSQLRLVQSRFETPSDVAAAADDGETLELLAKFYNARTEGFFGEVFDFEFSGVQKNATLRFREDGERVFARFFDKQAKTFIAEIEIPVDALASAKMVPFQPSAVDVVKVKQVDAVQELANVYGSIERMGFRIADIQSGEPLVLSMTVDKTAMTPEEWAFVLATKENIVSSFKNVSFEFLSPSGERLEGSDAPSNAKRVVIGTFGKDTLVRAQELNAAVLMTENPSNVSGERDVLPYSGLFIGAIALGRLDTLNEGARQFLGRLTQSTFGGDQFSLLKNPDPSKETSYGSIVVRHIGRIAIDSILAFTQMALREVGASA